ncbi:MAG: bifunctional diaminohydroxyphosphoribosylaminopyrimidine deaminase/5-amino-6-(5-phosphoribosylamino)uracil reductase RibD [Pseudomonadota bacterium]
MSDARWMTSALALARRALGRTWPNPAVGCVVVNHGRVIGRGVTAPGGRPHAEPQALAQAFASGCKGATVYVTLEPCAHHGQTPPCTDAIISAGVTKVFCAMEDPDPRVLGRGIAALREAGIEVDVGLLQAEARQVNAGFLSRIERGRPTVTLKLAVSTDGRIATRTGESRWITGPAARRRVHLMRARCDAVLIGAGTARIDDPMLDVRDVGLADRLPVRVVADSSLSIPLTGRLAATAGTQPLWIMHRADAPKDRIQALSDLGAIPITVADTEGVLSISDAMRELAARGITRVLCEGGGRIAASLLSEGLVDDMAIFTAGKALGGDGLPVVHGFGLEQLDHAPQFELSQMSVVDNDTLTWWRSAAPV